MAICKVFDVFCPRCNKAVAAKVISTADGNHRTKEPATNADADAVYFAEYYGDTYHVCLCSECSSPFLIHQEIYGIPREFKTITAEKILYPCENSIPVRDLPQAVGQYFNLARQFFYTSAFETCFTKCCKCLDAICDHLGVGGQNHKEKIEALFAAGHIDERLRGWSESLCEIAKHASDDPEVIATDSDNVRIFLGFMEALILDIFVISVNFKAFQKRKAD